MERLVSERYGRVSGSRPDGVQEKKGKKNFVRGLGNKKKKGGMELGEEEHRRKDSAQSIAQSFIPTVNSNNQCIYSIHIEYIHCIYILGVGFFVLKNCIHD